MNSLDNYICPLGNYCLTQQGSYQCLTGDYQNCPYYNQNYSERVNAILDGEKISDLEEEAE